MTIHTPLLRPSRNGSGSNPMQADAELQLVNADDDRTVAPGEHYPDSQAAAFASPRRVLYVVSQFPSLSETFIVREIDALIDRGVDVRILSLKMPRERIVHSQAAALLDRVLHPAGRWQTLIAICGVLLRQPVLSLSFFAMMLREFWRRPVTLAKSVVAISRALGRFDEMRAFSPELVHAPWATYPATVAWFLSRLLDIPFSFTSRAHDIFIEDHMMARKLKSASLAVAITEYNVRYMARWMPAPGAVPVHVIHSSLDLSKLSFVRSGRLAGKLLSVGRLVPMKGFDILLEALAELRARGVEFSCTVIGEGEERARLERLRTTLGLDGIVEFPGAMPQNDVVRHMMQSTLMVLPCVVAPNGQSDGIPNVLMESMATGLPVVSTRISGIPELVEDGVNGRLVAAGDAVALADAVQALLDDPHQCDCFAEAGRRKVERDFDVRIEAGRLFEHFGALCHA
jgi:glycosyltransferase involved in cell wall biosynthesis